MKVPGKSEQINKQTGITKKWQKEAGKYTICLPVKGRLTKGAVQRKGGFVVKILHNMT